MRLTSMANKSEKGDIRYQLDASNFQEMEKATDIANQNLDVNGFARLERTF